MHRLFAHRQPDEELRKSEARYHTVLDAAFDAIVTITPEGIVRWFNRGAERIFGYTSKEVIGQPVTLLMPERYRELCVAGLHRYLRTGEAHVVGGTTELVGLRKDGSEFPIEMSLGETYEDGDRLFTGVIRDVTERKEIEKALEESGERIRTLLQNTSDIITLLESDGTIRYISPAVERVTGYSPEEQVGTNAFGSVHPDDREQALNTFAEILKEPGLHPPLELRVPHKDGSWCYLEHVVNNLLDDPAVRGVVITSRDVTERKEAERKLREAEQRYRTLIEQGPAVVYIQEIGSPDSAMYMSPQIETLTGYSPEDCKDPDLRWRMVHPDDRERMQTEDDRTYEPGEVVVTEYRVLHRDGRTLWVRNESLIIEDETSGSRYWQGFMTDITDRKLVEEALRRSEVNLAEAQRIARLGSWEWDLKTGEVWWSDEAYRIFGFEPQQFSPTLETVAELFHPEDRHLIGAEIDDAPHKDEPYDFEHRIVRPDGKVLWVHRRGQVVRGDRGETLRIIGTIRDITKQKALEERLQYQAFHAPLTDLPNRRLFIDRLKQALRRTRRQKERKVAVLFMDLDNFKVVNDSLGHEVGDQLLVAVGQRLEGCLRRGYVVARFGGDEFTVLLEGVSDARHAEEAAERITRELSAPFSIEGHLVFVTTSIGIVLSDAVGGGSEDLLRAADIGLYRAKDKGKARYEVFDRSKDAYALERLELENDLRKAIEHDELKVYYQPVFSLV